jgi:NAD-dependent SIR2 family protein deacetylase
MLLPIDEDPQAANPTSTTAPNAFRMSPSPRRSYPSKMSAGEEGIARAARAVDEAEAFVFTAGAGMGVDSGLPDFRGDQGFWKAYPAYGHLGLRFHELANPRWFRDDPELAWGFYGHRLNLYRATTPHAGFAVLRAWAERAPSGAFVFTSNVDGQFQRAGFDDERTFECHGAIEWLQCLRGCGAPLWRAEETLVVDVDPESFRARPPLPRCPSCAALARPAILMFGDGEWDSARSDAQERRLERWLSDVHDRNIVVVECGAGTAIPTVRGFGERLVRALPRALLVRINVREPEVPSGQIALPFGARAALEAIDGARRRR